MTYSKKLDKHYTIDGDTIIFDDGVSYTQAEAQALKGVGVETIVLIHTAKRIFNAVVAS